MKVSLSALCLITLALGAVAATSAHATTISIGPGCSTYTALNGTSFFPGTAVGTVGNGIGQVCQIGNISNNNVSGSGVFVSNKYPTSIYSFYFDGGQLSITEMLGNNGTGEAVTVTLGKLATAASMSLSSIISATQIPFTSAPSPSYAVITNMNLVAGNYAIENQLANNDDPTFQINFKTAVPEPATMALLLAPLAAVTLRRRRATQA